MAAEQRMIVQIALRNGSERVNIACVNASWKVAVIAIASNPLPTTPGPTM